MRAKHLPFGSAFVFLFLLGISPVSAAPPSGYYLVWSDEFSGSYLDTSKWDYWLLGGRREAVNVTSAVAVGGGNLTITTYTSNSVHYTGIIATDGTFRSRYGYWETSIKWGDTNGMWSAFWMQSPTMGTFLFDPVVSGSEIDIAEHRFVDGSANNIANVIQPNVHWNGYGGSAASSGGNNFGSGLASGFHTYGFLWTSTDYTISIDGANVRNWNNPVNHVPVSQSSEWIILSGEVDDSSTTWAGQIPAAGYGNLEVSTTKLTADYVRYYTPTNTIFWNGNAGDSILTNSANYISNLPPLLTSDVTFSTLSGNSLSPTLGSDLGLHGLVFLWMNNGAVLNGTNTLTLGGGGIDMTAANHTVTINCPVNIGANQTWSVALNNPGNTLVVNGRISGSSTLSKGSWGTLILNNTNSFSGTLNVDQASTGGESPPRLSDGIVRITRSETVASVPTIAIRNNNAAWSTLQLTNLLGNLTIPANITLAGRNTNVAAIQNMSGSNTLSGNVTIVSGGGSYLFQSDGNGTLNFGGTISANNSVSSARTYTLQGNGNFYLSGSIQNGNATSVSLVKTNAGTLTITGNSTFSGATTNWRGNLVINGSIVSPLTIISGTLSGNGTVGGAVTIQSGGTLSPGSSIGKLTFANSATLLAGSATFLEINKSALTNDQVKVAGAISYGGTLTVTNLGGILLAGDSFKLFDATTCNGSFTTFVLPPLLNGLAWQTNALTNGVLSVVAVMAPVFTNIVTTPGGQLILNGRGAPGQNYELAAATNLIPPVLWDFITNIVAGTNGLFQYTEGQYVDLPQKFYRMLSP